MRIDPIPPSQVGQITAGLEGKGFQHIEAGNKEQVKKQVIAATAAVVGALASGAAVAISEERAMEDQGRDLRVVVPTTGCCPPTPLLPTPLPPPPSPSPINTFPPNITIDPALIPYTAATAQAPIPVVLIPTGTGLLTIPANAFEITAAMPTPVNLGRPLLQATLQTTDRGLVIGSSLLNVGGPFSSTTSLPVLSTDPTKIQTGADFIRIASGAQASVASSLVSDTGGKFDVGGSLIAVEGGGSLMSSSASPLIQLNTTNVKVAGDFVRLGSDGSAPGAAGSMLTIAGGSLLSLKNGSTASGLDGAFLTVSDGSVFNATPGSLATFGIGTNELRLQKAPLCSTGNCIRLFSTAYTILLRNGATVGNVFVDPAFVA